MSSFPDLRVIFVGNSQVGKTALMNRYIDGEFSPPSQTTINPIFTPSKATSQKGTEIGLQLWDTAGQEKYQALSQVFFRDSHVAVICYDPSDEPSVHSIQKWKSDVLKHEPNCLLILTATKIDLVQPDQKLDVITNIGQLAKENDIGQFFVTSALTGEGVNELFVSIATIGEEIFESQKNSNQPSKDQHTVNIKKPPPQKKGCPC